jgi:hypothetical protein
VFVASHEPIAAGVIKAVSSCGPGDDELSYALVA